MRATLFLLTNGSVKGHVIVANRLESLACIALLSEWGFTVRAPGTTVIILVTTQVKRKLKHMVCMYHKTVQLYHNSYNKIVL